MLKLIGSVMVFGSCAALGLSARQNLRRRVAAADAMLLALGLIRSEISGRRTPMPEIVGLLTENEQPIVRSSAACGSRTACRSATCGAAP